MTFKNIQRRRAKALTKTAWVDKHGVGSVILGPVTTEKAYNSQGNKEYHLYIAPQANKNDVRAALKTIYDVDAIAVRTILVPKKYRAQRGLVRRERKKAIVRIPASQDLTL